MVEHIAAAEVVDELGLRQHQCVHATELVRPHEVEDLAVRIGVLLWGASWFWSARPTVAAADPHGGEYGEVFKAFGGGVMGRF